jgi:uncharacterized membrane protein YfhO
VLFTAEDLRKQGINSQAFKREKPQKYYLNDLKPKIIERINNNVQNDATVMGKGINPNEEGKVQNLQAMLEQLNSTQLHIHQLQLRSKIKKEHYNELNLTSTKGKDNFIKYCYERINQAQGKPDVEYNIFSNGTIMIYVSCSNNPFRLYKEDDVSKIITYLGRVEGG